MMKAIENDFDSLLPHWPDRENFLKQQQDFIREYRDDITQQFSKENFPAEVVQDLVNICLRVIFVKQLFIKETKLDTKIDTEVIWEKKVTDRFRAWIAPHFFVKGEPVFNYVDVYDAAKENFEDVELRGASVFINLQEIIESLEQVYRNLKYWEMRADSIKGAEVVQAEMVDELALKTELAMVHELGHALFFHSVFSHKEKFFKWLEEHLGYDGRELRPDDPIPIYSEAELAAMRTSYSDKRIERAGDVLPSLFLKKYYPNSKVTI